MDVLYCTDIIHSVNGVSFKGISHAKALQILKQCGGSGNNNKNIDNNNNNNKLAKFVILRHKSKTEDVVRNLTNYSAGSHGNTPTRAGTDPSKSGQIKKTHKQLKQRKASDALPGTIANELKSHLVRPTLHRRTTENSSLNSIPTLSPSLSSSLPQNQELAQKQSRLLTVPTAQRSDDDDSSNYSSDPGTPKSIHLPKCFAVNERSTVGAFLITKEKSFKSLGLDVMVDELGLCHVTDVSRHGMFADDKRIRYENSLM